MLKRHLVLGSVASLALAVAASPAFAQSPPQYPDFSLPWEQAATQSLNAQQASEPGVIVTQTTASITPATTAAVAADDTASDVVAYNQALAAQQASQSQYSNEQSTYNSQLSDFQSKQGAYQQSWQDYQSKLNAYNERMERYRARLAAETSAWNAPVSGSVVSGEVVSTTPVIQDQWVSIYPRGYRRLVIVDTLTNADTSLRGAPVMDAMGNVVGNFRHMSLQDGGIPEAVITLNNQKTVAVGDQHLRYDPMANMIVADLTYNQMESMPARF